MAERLHEASSAVFNLPQGVQEPLHLNVAQVGGPQGSRTPDLRRAKAALSQLS